MTWKKQNPVGISIFVSYSTEIKMISSDLKTVLLDLSSKLLNYQNKKISEILIYINGTKGNISCSGFDSKNDKIFSDRISVLELTGLSEFCNSGEGGKTVEFDIIALDSINKLMTPEFAKTLTKNFDIFIKDEAEPSRLIADSKKVYDNHIWNCPEK